MRSYLPKDNDFQAFTVVELDAHGRLLHHGGPVAPRDVKDHLAMNLRVPAPATDVFVFVHGWQHDRQTAPEAARRLFSAIWKIWRRDAPRYPALAEFHPFFISVQWPSRSNPFPWGYRRIRDRAHAMTSRGYAAHVLAALLGYLDRTRQPATRRGLLQTAHGSYLHCVGHSFGCRLLGEAIKEAAAPTDPTLAWPWRAGVPFAVDSFLGIQMAAPPGIFREQFLPLVNGGAPLAGPIVLTHTPFDRALSMWHRIPEGVPGLGAVGATGAPTIGLRRLGERYTAGDFARLTNVDAGWLYRAGRLSPQGAHSDFLRPESIHLLMSLVNLSRSAR